MDEPILIVLAVCKLLKLLHIDELGFFTCNVARNLRNFVRPIRIERVELCSKYNSLSTTFLDDVMVLLNHHIHVARLCDDYIGIHKENELFWVTCSYILQVVVCNSHLSPETSKDFSLSNLLKTLISFRGEPKESILHCASFNRSNSQGFFGGGWGGSNINQLENPSSMKLAMLCDLGAPHSLNARRQLSSFSLTEYASVFSIFSSRAG